LAWVAGISPFTCVPTVIMLNEMESLSFVNNAVDELATRNVGQCPT